VRIVRGRPPIYDEIISTIGRPPAGAIFTWGETIYAPNAPQGMKLEISPALFEHEATHSRQQKIVGGPEQWWRQFLDSPDFRRQQELAAYRNQYAFACRAGLSRQARRQLLRELARDFSSQMYGRIIGRVEALEAIAG
jgi:hypothetical protein